MFRPLLRHLLAVLAVSLVLTTPLCEAASRGSAPGQAHWASPVSPDLLGLWDWMMRLWAKNGCSIDPGGQESGCGIDPGGIHPGATGSKTDGGCGIDPSGSPTCGGHS
jgi:hypothetical protein